MYAFWSGRFAIPETNALKRISYGILGMLTPSSVAGMQLIRWGENMIALVVGSVGECCSDPSYYSNCYILVKDRRFSIECP